MKARALPGEVHLVDVPGRPSVVLTRSEAIDTANALIAELKLPEPYIPRLSLWRRLVDWLRRRIYWRQTQEQNRILAARARVLMGADEVQR